jgi:zinc transport system substrate-binding protein
MSPQLSKRLSRGREAAARLARAGASICALAAASAGAAAAEPPLVVASIKPIHSLVAAVMDGAGAPHLLLPAGSSPHTYALKPSDAARLESAALVVWIGPDLEGYLAKPLSSRALKPKTLTLQVDASIVKHTRREGGLWAEGRAANGGQGHAHSRGATDPHLWLDPTNGRHIARAVAARLAGIDPANLALYAANAATIERDLAALETEIAAALAPVRSAPYLVFHDGYQYFERRFGLNPAGAVVIDPDRPPGAGRLAALRARISSGQIRCVFAEPQFAADRIAALVEGTTARVGTLDPYGTDVAAGPAAYPRVLRTLAASLLGCLSP